MIGSWWNYRIDGWARFIVGRRPAVTAVRAAVVVALYFGVIRTSFQPIRVTGASMEPTFHAGQLKLLNTWAYRKGEPARGDVVAIRKQRNRTIVLKRIVGMPGEEISVRGGGRVYINGELLQEPYAQGRGIPPQSPIILGPDQYFAIGDNRRVTLYDVIRFDEILGRAR